MNLPPQSYHGGPWMKFDDDLQAGVSDVFSWRVLIIKGLLKFCSLFPRGASSRLGVNSQFSTFGDPLTSNGPTTPGVRGQDIDIYTHK